MCTYKIINGKLDLSDMGLTEIPKDLPVGLITILKLTCNNITKLENIPESVLHLHAEYNGITTVGDLPTGLLSLYVCRNKIEYLDHLPSKLTKLFLSKNRLKSITLGNIKQLSHLDIRDNENIDVDVLPETLRYLYCDF